MTDPQRTSLRFAPHLEQLPPSAIREICRLVAIPDLRSLAGGWPDPAVFPTEEVRRILEEDLATAGRQALQYGATEGLLELRQLLAREAAAEGLTLTADQLMLTQGSQQAMDLTAAAFLDPGDVAVVGCPTYVGGTGAFATVGARLVGVPVDEDGIDPDALHRCVRTLAARKRPARLLYVIPNYQNPDGSVLPLERRRRLVELASRYGFVILEDDPYGALRFEGDPLPSLAALDPSGRVILARSFSKTISPGLRMAWVAASPEVLRRLAVVKQYRDCCTGNLSQQIVLGFLKRGLFEPYLARLRAHYRAKRDRMLAALDRHFPSTARWNRATGGFFVWITLPDDLDGEDLLQEALKRKVAYVPGRPFHVDGSGRNTIRLSFSQSDDASIDSAVADLGAALRELAARPRPPAAPRTARTAPPRPRARKVSRPPRKAVPGRKPKPKPKVERKTARRRR
ncbi:MAG: PLP-dependent aminotransferase family protein [Deltaproteobacteria bacterium]|nr:PLP-dependent aminotransferase family protein [Deltaproteobacteria bacterium]